MSTLQQFISSMNRAGGFARLSKYEIEIFPPEGMSLMGRNVMGGADALDYTKDISLWCDSVQMPGHDLKTQDVNYGSAPVFKQVTAHGYEGKCTATFYLDTKLDTKSYFEIWQQLAVNPITNKARYYWDYVGSMKIFQHAGMGRTYGVELEQVYPETIGEIEYSAASENAVANLTVAFHYHKWHTLSSLE